MRYQNLLLSLLFGGVLIVFCLAVAQAQPAALEAELAPPVYSTLAQSGGVKWIAYGYLYPVGTFAERAACEQPEGVEPIGSYAIRGDYGDASAHAALYRVTFGRANDGKQFVFAGIVEFILSEINQPEKATFAAARLIRGNFEEGWDAEYSLRSPLCFGGSVLVTQSVSVR